MCFNRVLVEISFRFYYECCYLIGYAIHDLFCQVMAALFLRLCEEV